MRLRVIPVVVVAAVIAGACGPRGHEPSRAADALIEKAATPEEREALERVRDEVDAEMRDKVRALDAEIERLRRENDELRRSLRRP